MKDSASRPPRKAPGSGPVLAFTSILAGHLLLGGCSAPSSSRNEFDTADEDRIQVRFTVPDAAHGTGGRDAAVPSSANEIIYFDIAGDEPVLHRQAITGPLNELSLPKSSINVIGFVDNPRLSRSSGAFGGGNARAIGSAITTIGNLQILSAGLDSLPISGSAENRIDLGNLQSGASSYNSMIDAISFQAATGYSPSEIESFSFYDNGLTRLLNPDVDGDGIHDVEESMLWELTARRSGGNLYRDDFSPAGPRLPVSALIQPTFALIFWLNAAFPHPPASRVFLEFPAGTEYRDRYGNAVTGMNASSEAANQGPGGRLHQYYFDHIDFAISSPVPPFIGDYTLKIDDQDYRFRNLSFFTPTSGSPEGFIFPETQITYDANDIVQTLSYSWWTVKNGAFVRPTETEVRLTMKQFYYYFPDNLLVNPANFGQAYYRAGVLDLSGYGIPKSELGYVGAGTDALPHVYLDRMGNEWRFMYFYNADRP